MDAIRSEIRELSRQLEEYDALRQGKLKVLELDSFEDLPRGLIQARIAAGLSQHELAARLGLKEQQIQHYESTDYASASIRRVQQVINALGVQVSEEIRLTAAGATEALSLGEIHPHSDPLPMGEGFLLCQAKPGEAGPAPRKGNKKIPFAGNCLRRGEPLFALAGLQGFEPQLSDPESDVLPLDDSPICVCSAHGIIP
jgi:transcriptional regulator with XRE-family HTH domain